MSHNPFITPFESLPETLPIFPLPGAVVMPGAELPLNIFEPRYLNMVNDALGKHRMIGMIQPDPDADNDIDVCRTGCAGRITQYRETRDCRIEMVLTGVCRFDVSEELSTTRGYRLVVPDWSRFSDDYVDHGKTLDGRHPELIETLKQFFETKGYEADLAMLERMPAARLADSLTLALPFSAREKQMLLETVDAENRLANFIALLDGEFEVPDSATRH
ncbi:MAG: LON peptidase substrate-binding domain-containing protein [Gammaproteobacteria bacterium]|nr:LON peptidase substrate-binding domain-containing protein [Gammaproteobacteria bacterium]